MTAILALDGASKSYGAVQALRGASLAVEPGEVRALVGENGAGKSTIVRLLAGVQLPDSGDVLVDGQPARFHNPTDARDAGIAVIYQEPTLFPDLSVAENVMMGRHPLATLRRIDRTRMLADVRDLLDRLGVSLDPGQPVRGLSIADQQIVEIAKALSFDARMLIMDEPTAALSGPEVERLFAVVRTLRDRGAGVLFISHRLDEVFAICSTVTVLRDGEVTFDGETEGLGEDDLVTKMVGRELGELFPKTPAEIGETLLRVERLTREGVFVDVSFEVRRGEIVGLAGLVGAGRSEVARAIFGIDRRDAGTVQVDGRSLPAGSPSAAMAAGIGLVPEDRRAQGLVMELSVARNVTLTRLRAIARLGVIGRDAERRATADWVERLRIKLHNFDDPVSFLSGGNQQKVVLAKWLATDPKVLIIDEPTRGIDVGTKAEVHRLMSELAGAGLAVLMISSELPEVLGMADRILVMHEGRLTAELSGAEATEEAVVRAATGQSKAAA
ncbi:MAG: rhamnose transport system ATP-binding protein [Chloroflexota bacterium]|nr:rhamnose transport system ATP-binding protein [Chloroflexota bacterium]